MKYKINVKQALQELIVNALMDDGEGFLEKCAETEGDYLTINDIPMKPSNLSQHGIITILESNRGDDLVGYALDSIIHAHNDNLELPIEGLDEITYFYHKFGDNENDIYMISDREKTLYMDQNDVDDYISSLNPDKDLDEVYENMSFEEYVSISDDLLKENGVDMEFNYDIVAIEFLGD